jgi:hypothetical protein
MRWAGENAYHSLPVLSSSGAAQLPKSALVKALQPGEICWQPAD